VKQRESLFAFTLSSARARSVVCDQCKSGSDHCALHLPSDPPVDGFAVANRCPLTSKKRGLFGGFTLLELLVVIGIIAIVLAFLIPSLGPASGRSTEAAARQLTADLASARLTALAERTRTRVLFPTSPSNFTAGSSSPAWPSDIALRGYLVISEKRTDTRWAQRGKWNRFPQGTALDYSASVLPSPTPMQVDMSGTGFTTTYTFNGPYIEFLANGSSNLDPSATPTPAAVVADGFVNATDLFVKKNSKLHYTITVDPLTGAVSLK
jgi:prepilin-type N-terminal cleavage/methylation domain-containing protein